MWGWAERRVLAVRPPGGADDGVTLRRVKKTVASLGQRDRAEPFAHAPTGHHVATNPFRVLHVGLGSISVRMWFNVCSCSQAVNNHRQVSRARRRGVAPGAVGAVGTGGAVFRGHVEPGYVLSPCCGSRGSYTSAESPNGRQLVRSEWGWFSPAVVSERTFASALAGAGAGRGQSASNAPGVGPRAEAGPVHCPMAVLARGGRLDSCM